MKNPFQYRGAVSGDAFCEWKRGQSENLGILSQGRLEEEVFTADQLFYGMIRESAIGKPGQTPQYNNIRNSGHEGGDFVFMKKWKNAKIR